MGRRRWLSCVVVLAVWMTLPGIASAAQTFSVGSPSGSSSFQANGDPSYTTSMTFDSSAGAPQTALITLSPGVLASLAANPSCLQSVQHTPACMIGSGSATLAFGLPLSLTAYLVPATNADDAAGIDLVSSASTSHAEVQLKQNASGAISSVLNVDLATAGTAGNLITGTSLTVNGTLGGKQFVRMPSNCSPGPSSLTVTYANGTSETSSASPDFTITGCSSLPYDPRVSAVVVKDAHDAGTEVTTTVTQNADEASTSAQTLKLPYPTLAANLKALPLQNTSTAVGTAVAYSPLLPEPLTGKVYLTGSSPFMPSLTIRFPPPNAITLTGAVNLDKSTVTFTGIPDVPQTKLVVTLFGGPQALESSNCYPPDGPFSASFTGQNGKVVTDAMHLVVEGCPKPAGAPSASRGSLSGSGTGKPVLRFTLARGTNAPNLKAFGLALPKGLSFDALGLHKGLSVQGVKVSATLKHGRLVVSLKHPVKVASVKLTAPLLVAKRHLHGRVNLKVTVTDATGTSMTIHLSIP
ncbi:MAG TPA: hypothetical protein VMD48_10400 [Solirubrobacteraceae bacterium]|nr:hypothetical protein [Solirubrobacteraceae bacterium]